MLYLIGSKENKIKSIGKKEEVKGMACTFLKKFEKFEKFV